MALGEIEETLTILTRGRLPHYSFPEEAARTLAAMARYAGSWRLPRYDVKTFTDVNREAVKRLIAGARGEGRHFLLEPEAHEIFQAYGFPVLPHRWVQSAGEAAQAGEELGYPVALKIVSPEIVHKVDVGGVKLALTGADAVSRP